MEETIIGSNNNGLIEWMSTLSPIIPWLSIIYPSTHNSSTHKIKPGIGAKWSILLYITPHLRRFIMEWTCCQSISLYNQLCIGIRIIDIRVSLHSRNQIWISHTLCCIPLIDALNDIHRFLMETSKEIIIVFVKPGKWADKGVFLKS